MLSYSNIRPCLNTEYSERGLKIMRKLLFMVILLLNFNAQAEDRLMFGINPGAYGQEDQWVLKDAFQPLAEYVGKAAGTKVYTDITQNFKATDEHANTGQYDLVMANTKLIGQVNQGLGYFPVAKFKDLHAVLLVKAESPYKTIASLKGSRIGIMSRKKLMGPLAVDFLKKHGFVMSRDFRQVQEIQYQDTLVSLVLEGAVDGIFVAPKIADDAMKAHPGKLRILAKTDPIPGFAIALSRKMPQAQANKITEALLTINQSASGKAALAAVVGQAAGNTALTKTSSEEYSKAMVLLDAAEKLYPPLTK